MQRFIERLLTRLDELGLVLNAGKTYVLLVPPLSWTIDQYEAARDAAMQRKFFARRAGEAGGAEAPATSDTPEPPR